MTKQNGLCVGRLVLSRASRFVFLSCAFFVVIGLIAFAEGIVLWLGGKDLTSKCSLQKVSIGEFSISALSVSIADIDIDPECQDETDSKEHRIDLNSCHHCLLIRDYRYSQNHDPAKKWLDTLEQGDNVELLPVS